MITVIDAGILMNTSQLPDITTDVVIAKRAYLEIKSSQSQRLLEMLEASYQLSVVSPEKKFRDQVKSAAKKVGQNRLSPQDIDVVAVAVMYQELDEVLLLSDDFGVRNVASALDIRSKSVTVTGGGEKRSYGYRCKACGTVVFETVDDCEICGNTDFIRFRKT